MPGFMTEAVARALYARRGVGSHQAGQPVTKGPLYTYGRDYYADTLERVFTNRASGATSLGVATNASILVVGSAFGYLIEALTTAGITDVWGIEPGAWCWDPANDADWAPGAKARTANDWIGSGTEQATLNALGIPGQAKFDWIVDEDVATMHSDAELAAFIAGLEDRLQGNVKGRIIHIVTPTPDGGGGDPLVNWKTMTEWEAIAPDHTWIDVRTL